MRVLVTRAIEDAGGTAKTLRAMGHEPILAPLRIRAVLNPPLPGGSFAGVIATSRHAFSGARLPAGITSLPCSCVGAKTAEAARAAGFSQAQALGQDGESLAAAMLERLSPNARLLYLAGSPRHPALEVRLAAAGFALVSVERYAMRRVPALPEDARAALEAHQIDAVLHYSSQSARAFFELCAQAGIDAQALQPLHLCLSDAVAASLPDAARRRIAARPEEASLLDQLDTAKGHL